MGWEDGGSAGGGGWGGGGGGSSGCQWHNHLWDSLVHSLLTVVFVGD